MPGAPPRPALRRLSGLLSLLLAIVSCASPEEGAGGRSGPSWIWRDHDLRHVEAAAFYLVRDFDLGAMPREATIRIVGDEEYILTLNEHRIGSRRWRMGEPGDEFDVTPVLTGGRNRLIVEMRSATGSGGMWLDLVADGRELLRSDSSWSWYEDAPRGLFGGFGIPAGARPLVYGPGPLGRWGAVAEFVRRPLFESVLEDPEPIPALFTRDWTGSAPWQPVESRSRRPPSLGPLVEVDFGEERFGYLQLAYRGATRGVDGPVLVRFGRVPLSTPPVQADLMFRPIPGRNLYQDATPRRFRYVGVAALPGLFEADVRAIRGEVGEELGSPESWRPVRGILGVRPPRSRSPVENEVWRELERATGLRVGERR